MLAVFVFHAGMYIYNYKRTNSSFLCICRLTILWPLFRPPWNTKMSVEELDTNERSAFLVWRRSLARSALLHVIIY